MIDGLTYTVSGERIYESLNNQVEKAEKKIARLEKLHSEILEDTHYDDSASNVRRNQSDIQVAKDHLRKLTFMRDNILKGEHYNLTVDECRDAYLFE